jgi:hypothetical protein
VEPGAQARRHLDARLVALRREDQTAERAVDVDRVVGTDLERSVAQHGDLDALADAGAEGRGVLVGRMLAAAQPQ